MTIADLMSTPRLLRSLGEFFATPLTPARAAALVRQRLERREERFLAHVDRVVFGVPHSPYRTLLQSVGCDRPALAQAVRAHGLEGALAQLRDAGVYLSYEEFNGRREVVRGGRTFRFTPADFDNPLRDVDLEVRSGGTRSRRTPVLVALRTIAENRAVAFQLMFQAAGVDAPPVVWLPGFPSGSGVFFWLALAHIGRPAVRWFTVTDPRGPSVAPRHRWLITLARLVARQRGWRLPVPEHAPLSAPEPVLEAVLRTRDRFGRCAVISTPSGAVRVATRARRREERLEGVDFFVGSEPLTEGKAEEIRRSGARVWPRYVFTEGGAVGVGCGRPEAVDDMHLMADSFALILHRRPMPGIGERDAYMFTSLLQFAPKVMLNVESDDFGTVTSRRCGCPLDSLGLDRHLAQVRSFTKLTGEGATVLGTEAVRILEEVLPRTFGGSSLDYQLLEAEDEERLTRLFLVVSPELGPLDEEAVRRTFIDELWRAGVGLSEVWFPGQGETVRVLRREPVQTPGGKLLPFYSTIRRDGETSTASSVPAADHRSVAGRGVTR